MGLFSKVDQRKLIIGLLTDTLPVLPDAGWRATCSGR